MPRFAANLWYLFQEVDLMDRFEAAAKAGFKAVEIQFPYQWPSADLAERLDAFGLRQVLINAPAGDWEAGERGLAALPGREEEFRDSIGQAIDYGRALGCPAVHVMAGVLADDRDRQRAMETYAENLAFAAARCSEEGIKVLIEALNPLDAPGYLIANTAEARSVIDAISPGGPGGPGNLYMQYDLYHGAMNGEDLIETISANLGVIGHMQVAGVPGRHEPDSHEPGHSGGGDIDYEALFEAIDGLGYTGWIGCEYRPRAGTAEGLGWAAAYGIG